MCHITDGAIDHQNWLDKQPSSEEIIECLICHEPEDIINTIKLSIISDRICVNCCENGSAKEWLEQTTEDKEELMDNLKELKTEYENLTQK